MTKQINPIETEIAEYLTSHGVTFTATGGTATKRDEWECDHWSVSFTREGKPALTTDYYTGIGHRKSKYSMPIDIKRLGKNIVARVEWEKQNVKAVAPHVAGVLSSLLMEAQSGEQNFHDWCDELGYDKDSIKDQATYNACCETLNKMRSFFTGTERQEMQDILQDY